MQPRRPLKVKTSIKSQITFEIRRWSTHRLLSFKKDQSEGGKYSNLFDRFDQIRTHLMNEVSMAINDPSDDRWEANHVPSPHSSLFNSGPARSQRTWREEEQQGQKECPVIPGRQPEEHLTQEKDRWDGADPGGSWTYGTKHANPREGITGLR